jgi:hypothetical protein
MYVTGPSPRAASTRSLVALGNLPSTFLLAPVLAGAVADLFCYVWHRGVRRQPWPRRWL